MHLGPLLPDTKVHICICIVHLVNSFGPLEMSVKSIVISLFPKPVIPKPIVTFHWYNQNNDF